MTGKNDATGRFHVPAPRLTLTPVLVAGIQSTCVCAAEESFQPKDLVWLDSCDKHRNEGRGEYYCYCYCPAASRPRPYQPLQGGL
ncbi:hypothetical protein SAMN05216595_4412 [Rhizobium sp. AN6A]|nr:hypothetical protein SAMN05216595_4412 [Rhizobium sp. AN6A]